MKGSSIDGTAAKTWFTWLVMAGSALLCGYGAWSTGGFATSAWTHPRATVYGAAAIVALLLLLGLLSRRIRLDAGFVLAVCALVLVGCFAGLGATAAVMLQLIASFCIGRRLYPAAAADDSTASNAAIATACGLAVLAFVVGLMSFLPFNNPAVYLLLLALPIMMGWRDNVATARSVLREWARPAVDFACGWTSLLRTIIAFALVLRLLAVLQPETGADALTMHLVVAEQLKLHGRFHYDPTQSIWALMPLAGDWLFAIANMLEGQHAARLLNFATDALVVLLVHEYATRSWGRLAGAAAAALYATTPLLYLVTISLFIENPWTLWCVTALLTGLRSMRTLRVRDAMATGLLLGAAFSAKVITLFLAPFFAAIAVVWLLVRGQGIRMLSAFASIAAIVASVPYANAWLRTGNPVFPFMNHVFKSPYFDAAKPFGNSLFQHNASWNTLYDVTFQTGRYLEALPGALGIGFLVVLPAALVAALFGSWRLRCAALFALTFVILVFQFQAYLRYIMPMLPVFAVIMGAAVATLTTERPAFMRVPALGIVVACSLAGLYLTPTSTFLHREISLPAYAGSEAEETYLARIRPEQTLARVIDAMQLERVLWIGSPYYAGADTEVISTNWHGGHVLVTEFNALDSVEALQGWIAKHKFHAIALASDANACQRRFICDFLERKATKVFEIGQVALYLPDPDVLFGEEMLENGGFDHGMRGWNGASEQLSADGVVVVTAQTPFTQAVPVVPDVSYALEVEGRCTGQGGSFRSQVNWLDGMGGFITTDIAVFECNPDFTRHVSVVGAPKGAATAIVYASGHLPDRSVEITRVSFRR